MTTITGKIEDATGATLHATIDFVSRSTPLAAGGVVTTNTDKRIKSNPADGTFSVQLAPGNYQVTIAANGQSSNFFIVVPDDDNTYTIDTLVTTPLAFVLTPPNTVFNGFLQGDLTFDPTQPPPAPAYSVVNFPGGNISLAGFGEIYSYWLSYVTQTGETILGGQLDAFELPSVANKANRIFTPLNPTGVTAIRIWRTYLATGHAFAGNPSANSVELLAVVSPSAGHYDDWESTAQFAARVDPTIAIPSQNTTAGNIVTSPGGPVAFRFNDQGVSALIPFSIPGQPLGPAAGVITKTLLDQVFGGGVSTSDVLFRFATSQFQMWDVAAANASNGATPWRALGVNAGATVWSAPIASGGVLDSPFAIPSGANYRFANGEFQFWDAAQFILTPTTPWRAVGISNGALYWSTPIADAGATLDTLPNPPNANWRAKNGQLHVWDQPQAINDFSRPWRTFAPLNGATIVSNPISN